MSAKGMSISDIDRAAAVLALEHQLITPVAALSAMSASREPGGRPLTSLLVDAVGGDEKVLLAVIARELEMPFVDLFAPDVTWRPDEDQLRRLDMNLLRAHNAMPLRGPNNELGVALANPVGDQDMVDYLRAKMPDAPVLVLAPATQIQTKLLHFDTGGFDALPAGDEDAPTDLSTLLPTQVTASPVIDWVDQLLARAAAENASDVHFLFEADGSLLVRFRVDGTMRVQPGLRKREREIVGTLLAKCANIDASDRTRPQDGTFSFKAIGGRQIDARLGMLPQAYGPTVVVRLLDPANINRRLEEMGFATATLEQMRRVVRSPQGAVLFIGPTGSGKTTTLYGLLKELPALEMNIQTAEDPIEYRLPHIGQTQIRGDLGEKSLTFAKTLRAMLRLDPDVILVGEIRDGETADTAMHAALTGHMVLSTLHAKSALGVYSRLEELGVEPFLAAESLSLAVNQRLLRRVHECAVVEEPNASERAFLDRMKLPVPVHVTHARPRGCDGCNGTGYRGRLAVVEVLEPSVEVRTMVAERRAQSEVLRAARSSEGYLAILTDAYRHVVEGRTTVTELLRCVDTGGQ